MWATRNLNLVWLAAAAGAPAEQVPQAMRPQQRLPGCPALQRAAQRALWAPEVTLSDALRLRLRLCLR